MELTYLLSHQSLITETSAELITLVSFLGIPADISLEDDHVFIVNKVGTISLGSFLVRRDSDVLIANETYSEILIDIASGMEIKTAFEKQGYTF